MYVHQDSGPSVHRIFSYFTYRKLNIFVFQFGLENVEMPDRNFSKCHSQTVICHKELRASYFVQVSDLTCYWDHIFASKLNRDQVLIHIYIYIVLASSRHGFNEWRRRNTLLYYNTACCSCNIRFWAGPASKIRRTNNNRHNNNGMMNSLGILLFTLCMYILYMYNFSFMKKLKSKLWTLLSIKWRNTPVNWSITQLLVVDSIVYFHMPCKLQV